MLQDRIKTVFWLWLFKSLQPCFASRRSSFDDSAASSTYSRLGRLPLSGEPLAMWRSGGGSFDAHKMQPHARGVFPDNYHGLNLQLLGETTMARPASLKGTWKHRDARPSPTVAASNAEHAIQLTRPLIPEDAWEATTGSEFEDSAMVEALTQSGLELCTSKGNEDHSVEWFSHPNTDRLLEEHKSAMLAMEEGNVLVYVGKVKRQENIVGSKLPLIKTQSILPLSAEEMADLLMDSSKVKIYNKMSLGRKDVRIFDKNTKIVCNLTQPPMSKSKMVSVTLMHSRALTDKDRLPSGPASGFVVVSRAVPGMVDEDLKDLPRNDILLGVNLVQDISPNECLMTAVTHVYSPALPVMLAKSMGVTSAVNFIRDIRASCEPVAAE